MSSARTRWTTAGALGLGLAVLSWNLARSWVYVTDDAFISLRYARRLARGDGLTFNDGEAVEGYSNLLWVLLLAAADLVGLDPERAMTGIGVGCVGLLLAGLAWALRPLGAVGQIGMLVLVALSGPLGIWAQAGLENGLLTALTVGAAAALLPLAAAERDPERERRGLAVATVLLSLAVLTRPDAPVIVAGLALGVFLASGQGRVALGRAAVVAVVPALVLGLHVLFRLGYYGDPLPNTAYAKLDGASLDRAEAGVRYLWPWLRTGQWLWLLAAFGAFLPVRVLPNLTRLLLPVSALWVAWVVRAGGDHFPAFRMVVWMEPLRDLLAVAGVVGLLERAPAGARRPLSAAVLLLLVPLGVGHWRQQEATPDMVQARFTDWTPRLEPLGRMLGTAFGEAQPLLAISAAGIIPYHADIPVLDLQGLTNRHIARQRIRPGEIGFHGHEAGDTAYVRSRNPDLVLLCTPGGGARGCLPQEDDLLASPGFTDAYRLAWLRGETPRVQDTGVFFRWESEVVGVRRTGDRVVLPVWFLATDPERPAGLGPDGRLGLIRSAGEPLVVDDLPVVSDPGRPVDVVVRDGADASTGWTARLEASEEHPGRGRLSLRATVDARVTEVWLVPSVDGSDGRVVPAEAD